VVEIMDNPVDRTDQIKKMIEKRKKLTSEPLREDLKRLHPDIFKIAEENK
jgi:hypothetical protein